MERVCAEGGLRDPLQLMCTGHVQTEHVRRAQGSPQGTVCCMGCIRGECLLRCREQKEALRAKLEGAASGSQAAALLAEADSDSDSDSEQDGSPSSGNDSMGRYLRQHLST